MKSFFIAIQRQLQIYDSKVNWIVFCLVFCFTIGSWIDVNGLWCELPIMVHELPEGWKLPSILIASTQIAQISPILFLLGRWRYPTKFSYVVVIYIILTIGGLSCLMLSFVWNKTAFIFGENRSIGLIILNFSLAFLDGTSTVTFLPYIGGNFAKEYLIPNYVGESLAALIPAIVSLTQGLGQPEKCENVTQFDLATNTSTLALKPISITPNFSVSVYFGIMFVLLCMCTIAFTLLNFAPFAKRERKNLNANANSTSITSLEAANSIDVSSTKSMAVSMSMSKVEIIRSPEERTEIVLLNFYTCLTTFIYYGILPGLQTYSTLPYGNDVFNYSVNLSFLFIPLAIILSIWSYEVSIKQITIELAVALGFSGYIIFLGIRSPCPPLLDHWFGPFITIVSWIVTQTVFMRVRCLIAARLERFGQNMLLVNGAMTQIGQMFGGLIIFFIVNIYDVFKSRPDCLTDSEFHNLCK